MGIRSPDFLTRESDGIALVIGSDRKFLPEIYMHTYGQEAKSKRIVYTRLVYRKSS